MSHAVDQGLASVGAIRGILDDASNGRRHFVCFVLEKIYMWRQPVSICRSGIDW